MRNIILFSLITFILTACGTPVSSTPAPGVVQATASPVALNLGKCVDARVPTPNPNEPSLFPPVSEQDHILGVRDAYVTILVYSDFQCASCAKLAALLKSLVEKYPQNVRVIFRHFPLESIHDKAALSAQAAEAAALQGKFWE
ncbi:MAG: thioredoxin domain-containing protein, partial [Chloroflexi bacterium]|nr:thioredoxin domain-containing protein [Chloroflexota bacterium]